MIKNFKILQLIFLLFNQETHWTSSNSFQDKVWQIFCIILVMVQIKIIWQEKLLYWER